MRVLLTGAAGFIGSTLARRLLRDGCEVTGLDAFDETLYPSAYKRRYVADLLAHPRFELIEGNILDMPLVERLAARRPDAIVHLAALAGVRNSLNEPRRAFRVNVEGTVNLLEAARLHGITRFLFTSSSSVYDPLVRDAPPLPLRESDATLRPVSPYGASKRAAELYCSSYSDVYGLHTTCLRLFSVYGPCQRPDLAIHKFTRLLIEGRPVPIFGDGSSLRDYTYVDDAVAGIVAALDRIGSGPRRHRVYNLGAGRTTTLHDLLKLLERAVGRDAVLDRHADQAGDVFATLADTSRARDELGYAPTVSIEEGVARFVKWYIAERSLPRHGAQGA